MVQQFSAEKTRAVPFPLMEVNALKNVNKHQNTILLVYLETFNLKLLIYRQACRKRRERERERERERKKKEKERKREREKERKRERKKERKREREKERKRNELKTLR
jgi:hypothetical protein